MRARVLLVAPMLATGCMDLDGLSEREEKPDAASAPSTNDAATDAPASEGGGSFVVDDAGDASGEASTCGAIGAVCTDGTCCAKLTCDSASMKCRVCSATNGACAKASDCCQQSGTQTCNADGKCIQGLCTETALPCTSSTMCCAGATCRLDGDGNTCRAGACVADGQPCTFLGDCCFGLGCFATDSKCHTCLPMGANCSASPGACCLGISHCKNGLCAP